MVALRGRGEKGADQRGAGAGRAPRPREGAGLGGGCSNPGWGRAKGTLCAGTYFIWEDVTSRSCSSLLGAFCSKHTPCPTFSERSRIWPCWRGCLPCPSPLSGAAWGSHPPENPGSGSGGGLLPGLFLWGVREAEGPGRPLALLAAGPWAPP